MLKQPRAVVKWSDDLALGIPPFDNEHRVFINQISRFVERVEMGAPKVLVDAAFDKVVDTFTFHIQDEQNIQEARDYPERDLREHERAHHRLIELMNSVRMELMGHVLSAEHANLARLVAEEVITHIDTHDRDLARFLIANGAAISHA